jgi:hypothetical protein
MQNQPVQTLETIEHEYHDQWVLVKETEWDEQGNPIKGILIAHGVEREALTEPRIQLHEQEPNVKTFAFYAGPKVADNFIKMWWCIN